MTVISDDAVPRHNSHSHTFPLLRITDGMEKIVRSEADFNLNYLIFGFLIYLVLTNLTLT